jgi:hypothetical protein
MNLVLETFATEASAERDKIILLVQDRAGWRHEVVCPKGLAPRREAACTYRIECIL